MSRILVVDDEEGLRAFPAEGLGTPGHEGATAASGDEALRRLAGPGVGRGNTGLGPAPIHI